MIEKIYNFGNIPLIQTKHSKIYFPLISTNFKTLMHLYELIVMKIFNNKFMFMYT